MKINKIELVGFLLSLLLLSSCTSSITQGSTAPTEYTLLRNDQTLGQTSVADFDGLEAITLYLKPAGDQRGTLNLTLRENPIDNEIFRTAKISLADVINEGEYPFTFQSIQNSNQHEYYLDLELDNAEDGIWVGIAPGNSYINGALYSQGTPQDLQLAFNLTFNKIQAVVGLTIEALTWFGWIAAMVFIFLPPGWAILMLLWRRWDEFGWIEKFCLAMGTGFAFYPILLIFTHLIGINLGSWYAWLFPAIGIVLIVWHNFRSHSIVKRFDSLKWGEFRNYPHFWENLTFILLVALIFGVRFWNIRGIEIPMWGDSYQHTMITQLMIDNRGMFSSWEPYVPYQSLSVHFGFSFAAALFSWITDLPSAPATLIFGQLINGLAVLLLYPWALRVSKNNSWAACSTVLIAGLITQTPAIYVNWGRYAQLSGQVILPVAFLLLWRAIELNTHKLGNQLQGKGFTSTILKFSWSKFFITGFVIAGMMLYYYRMPIFFATLIVAWLIGWGLPILGADLRKWINLLLALMITGFISILLILPWLYNLINVNAVLLTALRPPAVSLLKNILEDYRSWFYISSYLPGLIVVCSVIALIFSLFRKSWVVASLGLWIFFLSLLVAGRLVRFPGSAAMQNFAVVILLYIPASILVGWLIGESTQPLIKKWHTAGKFLLSACFLALAIWGSIKMGGIDDPNTYALVNRPDLHAMEWIKENTPANSRFLVEGFRIYGGTSAVGSDAGWWISLLAARQNTMPPQYALLNEIPSPADYSQRAVDIVATLENNSPGSVESIQMICEEQITHAFIGQSQGLVGAGVQQLYSPEDFLNSPFWKKVFQQDRVYIFELDPAVCQQ